MKLYRTLAVFYAFLSSFSLYSNEPIYAVMITGKDIYHKKLAICSIESFKRQTYNNKHLIIINDGTYSLKDYCESNIKEIKLKTRRSLGELRNIGLKSVPKDAIWVQWDDDDWHHEKLIEEQCNFMKQHKADGVILKNQVQYSTKKSSAWRTSRSNGIEGTIMMRRCGNIHYPKKAKGEDTIFIKAIRKKHKIIVWPNPDYYYLRFIHGHNTWNENHFSLYNKPKGRLMLNKASKEYLLRTINYFYNQFI